MTAKNRGTSIDMLVRDGYLGVLKMINQMLEVKTPYLKGHSARVSEHSVGIARVIGLDASGIEIIRCAAILHDIGKMGVSDLVLMKPGELNEDEWEEMRKHPVIGRRMVEEVKMFRAEEPIIEHHHEWYDGKGYPAGLKFGAIPLGSRIISVADAYDAMVTSRPYRKALPSAAVRKNLKIFSGTQFDPDVVRAFLSTL